MKICVLGGVRPDWVNLVVLLEEFKKQGLDYFTIHSKQHYDWLLDGIFFKEMNIEEPKYFLDIGSGLEGEQTSKLLERSEKILLEEKPNLAVSFSDANPSLYALVASKNLIKVAHLESGMRSMDFRMKEEKNRRMIDSISDILFCPTDIAYDNLIREGIKPEKIFVSGKLIFDVLEKFKDKIDKSAILERLGIRANEYIAVTLHRPENVDDFYNLSNLLEGLNLISKEFELPIVAPLHPRTIEAIKKFNIKVAEGIHTINPLGFFDFVKLEKYCLCYIGDSGTATEECCVFHKPAVTVRPSTERPETVFCGANMIAGNQDGTFNPVSILRATQKMVESDRNWELPEMYEPGAAKFITKTLKQKEDWIMKKKVLWDD
nr:UDP-N-acetylglucosamine 2-epimerase (non-hydrolyzing) [Nanoarchaeum sp.]